MVEFLDLADLLHRGRDGEHPVALQGPSQLVFSTFEQDAAAWCRAFVAHPGSKFAFYFHDSYEFASALFGAWHAKKTVYLLADVLPANLVDLHAIVDGFAGDVPGVPCVHPLRAEGAFDWEPLDRHARSLVVYTSGSSGAPAAISKRLSQLFDEVAALAQCFGEHLNTASVCATVSHQHIYGLLFAVLLPLACGRPFSARRLGYAEEIAAELSQNGAHVLIASPAHLRRLPEQLAWQAASANLCAVFSSGGPLPDEALPLCLRTLGQAPIEVYGSSETGGVAWRQHSASADGVWQALPGVVMKVEDQRLHICSAHTDSHGWQALSDQVRAVGNGFELLGRADRIHKIEEKRVSLGTVERALVQTGLVAEVRVLVESGRRTQLIVVAVPSSAGWQLIDKEGKQALNARLRLELERVIEPTTVPRRWRYVSALPLNTQGKTTESALFALFDPRRPNVRLLRRTSDSVSLQVEILPTSPYFDGHFAGTPILPGVAQLDWVVLFGREFFGLPAVFSRLESVKFQRVIQPGMAVEMALNYESDRGRLSFTLSSPAGAHASGRFVFGAAQ